jgi:hypothetical protein
MTPLTSVPEKHGNRLITCSKSQISHIMLWYTFRKLIFFSFLPPYTDLWNNTIQNWNDMCKAACLMWSPCWTANIYRRLHVSARKKMLWIKNYKILHIQHK